MGLSYQVKRLRRQSGMPAGGGWAGDGYRGGRRRRFVREETGCALLGEHRVPLSVELKPPPSEEPPTRFLRLEWSPPSHLAQRGPVQLLRHLREGLGLTVSGIGPDRLHWSRLVELLRWTRPAALDLTDLVGGRRCPASSLPRCCTPGLSTSSVVGVRKTFLCRWQLAAKCDLT